MADETPKKAFQCKNCGHTVSALEAGEQKLPRACPVCRVGDKGGQGDPENWIVLAELSDKDLKQGFAKHGLTRADIEEHSATQPEPSSDVAHVRTATEGVGAKDKA